MRSMPWRSIAVCVHFAIFGAWLVAAEEPLLLAVPRVVDGAYEISLVTMSGKITGSLLKSELPVVEPVWSPNGTEFLYCVIKERHQQIHKAKADGSGAVNLSNNSFSDRHAAWSPDGKTIAFTSGRSGCQNIWSMNADGSDPKPLTNQNEINQHPSWSPDGKQILYMKYSGVYRMNADGSELSQLFSHEVSSTCYPLMSRDGRQIIFGGGKNVGTYDSQLFICSLDGSGLEQLTSDDKNCGYHAWSPDGQYLAYVRFLQWPIRNNDGTMASDASVPNGDLMLLDTLSGEHRELLHDCVPMCGPRPSWQPPTAK
jgi:TolB protein